MKIWLFKVGEPVPTDEGDLRLYRTGMLSYMLADKDHQVTWWTSTVNHIKKEQRFHENTTVKIKDSLEIIFLHSLLYKTNVSISRIINHVGTARAFTKLSNSLKSPDIILCCLPILELCQAAIKYGKLHNIPVVIDIRDLWPDIFLKLGPSWVKPFSRLLLSPMFKSVEYICRNATAITGITPEIVDWGLNYAKRPKSDWDKDFPFGYSTENPDQESISKSFNRWEKLGVRKSNNKFIACFFGNFGRQFELETVIEAARYLENSDSYRGQFQFVLCGSGDRFSYYSHLAQDCKNIIFPGWVNKVDIWTLMRISAVGLTPNRSTKDFTMAISNKPIEYMSSGLPIVSSLGGKLRQFLEQHTCGLTYENKDINGLVNILIELKEDPEMLEVISKNAKKVFQEKFSADKVYGEMIQHLESIANSCPLVQIYN